MFKRCTMARSVVCDKGKHKKQGAFMTTHAASRFQLGRFFASQVGKGIPQRDGGVLSFRSVDQSAGWDESSSSYNSLVGLDKPTNELDGWISAGVGSFEDSRVVFSDSSPMFVLDRL